MIILLHTSNNANSNNNKISQPSSKKFLFNHLLSSDLQRVKRNQLIYPIMQTRDFFVLFFSLSSGLHISFSSACSTNLSGPRRKKRTFVLLVDASVLLLLYFSFAAFLSYTSTPSADVVMLPLNAFRAEFRPSMRLECRYSAGSYVFAQ